jgi:uncharacterized protein
MVSAAVGFTPRPSFEKDQRNNESHGIPFWWHAPLKSLIKPLTWLILYLDTSALVKLYAEEADSGLVRQAVADSEIIATSLMAYVETRSALARKGRNGAITRSAFNRCRREFERDWARLHRLPVDEILVLKAGELAEEHALRALHALHLATADFLRAAVRAAVTFACFDGTLNEAAQARGLELLARKKS